jgi:hypothetical protein
MRLWLPAGRLVIPLLALWERELWNWQRYWIYGEKKTACMPVISTLLRETMEALREVIMRHTNTFLYLYISNAWCWPFPTTLCQRWERLALHFCSTYIHLKRGQRPQCVFWMIVRSKDSTFRLMYTAKRAVRTTQTCSCGHTFLRRIHDAGHNNTEPLWWTLGSSRKSVSISMSTWRSIPEVFRFQ